MPRTSPPPHLASRRALRELGGRLETARLSRQLTQAALAERVGVTRQTIAKLEGGDATVSLATLVRVLAAFRLQGDIALIAGNDAQGVALALANLKRPVAPSAIAAPPPPLTPQPPRKPPQ